MSRAKNVVWREGLFLTPHLFQQSDRYHEDLLQFRLKQLTPFFWGAVELEIDREALPWAPQPLAVWLADRGWAKLDTAESRS